MQLGFVSAILPDLSLEEVLQFAADEGYDCVEAMCWPVGKAERKYAGVTHIDVAAFTQGQADDVLALQERYGVAISALGYYPNVLDGDEENARRVTEHLRKVIAAAPRLGLSTVNTFIGADHRRNSEENFERFRQVWPDLIRWAEDHGVRIGIENCPMLFTFDEWPAGKNLAASPVLWRRMFDAIPSDHFGLNFDPSHCVWQFIDYLAPLQEFRDRLFHCHAKDLKIEWSRLRDRGVLALGWSTPKIPGLGDVDWGRFFSALTDAGYRGPVCVEVEDESFGTGLEGRKRALRISRNLLRPFIA